MSLVPQPGGCSGHGWDLPGRWWVSPMGEWCIECGVPVYRDSRRVSSSVADPERGVVRRLETFLGSYPGVPLTVVTQRPTPKGISWLAARCGDRPVRLVIGRYLESQFKKANVADRRRTAAFLKRADVVVKGWGSDGSPMVDPNLRVWVVHVDPVPAVLVLSADLTYKSLEKTWGLAAEVAEHDRGQVVVQVEGVIAEAEDHKEVLLELLAVEQPRHSSPSAGRPPPMSQVREHVTEQWWNRRESEPGPSVPKAWWRGLARNRR